MKKAVKKAPAKKKAPTKFEPGYLTVNVNALVTTQPEYDTAKHNLIHIISIANALSLNTTPPLFFPQSMIEGARG